MSGPKKNCNLNYKKYLESCKLTGEPVMEKDLPPYDFDLRGISKYAKEKGVTVPELSEEEKEMFKIYKNVKNNETLGAIEETEEIIKKPNNYRSYSNAEEMMKDILD